MMFHQAYCGEDIGRGVELSCLAIVRTVQVGFDEFLHHVGFLNVGIVGMFTMETLIWI